MQTHMDLGQILGAASHKSPNTAQQFSIFKMALVTAPTEDVFPPYPNSSVAPGNSGPSCSVTNALPVYIGLRCLKH